MLIANRCHVPHFVAKRHTDATTSGSAGPFAALPQVREGQNKSVFFEHNWSFCRANSFTWHHQKFPVPWSTGGLSDLLGRVALKCRSVSALPVMVFDVAAAASKINLCYENSPTRDLRFLWWQTTWYTKYRTMHWCTSAHKTAYCQRRGTQPSTHPNPRYTMHANRHPPRDLTAENPQAAWDQTCENDEAWWSHMKPYEDHKNVIR